ncbi:MAG: MBL fold metallo-hydrolase [Treponema sp.]|nr:MBL fold metallo-hydrolase [Treponema sp.]
MEIQFWGVRGSLPSPLHPDQVKEKINEVVRRLSPKDLESKESKEKFLKNLPEWLYGTAGGNTPCVSLFSENGEKVIFDAGSGIRLFGKSEINAENPHYSLFFSHFHWDHIQGLPFFDPAYNQNAIFDVYSPFENMRGALAGQMTKPFYPVSFDSLSKNFSFHQIEDGKVINIGDLRVNSIKMSHPGGSCSYSVCENGKKFVYATDVELCAGDFEKTSERRAVFENADALVFDAQYTAEEAVRKEKWGHSAFCYALDFASFWNVKRLYLFHHEPTYDDKKLNKILTAARWYSDYILDGNIEVYLASEGQKIKL